MVEENSENENYMLEHLYKTGAVTKLNPQLVTVDHDDVCIGLIDEEEKDKQEEEEQEAEYTHQIFYRKQEIQMAKEM